MNYPVYNLTYSVYVGITERIVKGKVFPVSGE